MGTVVGAATNRSAIYGDPKRFNVEEGFDARLGERARIARELHDCLLQGVQGLVLRLQAVRNLLPAHPEEAMQALDIALDRGDQVILEGRSTVEDLRHSSLENEDIVQDLTALGEELAKDNGDHAPVLRVLVEGKQRELEPHRPRRNLPNCA